MAFGEPKIITIIRFKIVLDQTQYVGMEFGIFGWFRWVLSLILVDEPGLERVQSSKRFEVRYIWVQSNTNGQSLLIFYLSTSWYLVMQLLFKFGIRLPRSEL